MATPAAGGSASASSLRTGATSTGAVASSESTKNAVFSFPNSLFSTTGIREADADYQAQTAKFVGSVGQCNIRGASASGGVFIQAISSKALAPTGSG